MEPKPKAESVEYAAALKRLERLYHLMIAVLLTLVMLVLASFATALWAFLAKGPGFINGAHLVTMLLIVMAGFVVLFSFAFKRTAIIRAKINRAQQELEIGSGDAVSH